MSNILYIGSVWTCLKQQQEFECFELQNCYENQEITLPFYA